MIPNPKPSVTLPAAESLEIVSARQQKDTLGRMRPPATREECVAMTDDFVASGLTGAEYARKIGLNYATFSSRFLRVRKSAEKEAREVKVQSSPASVSQMHAGSPQPAFQEMRVVAGPISPEPRDVAPIPGRLIVTLPGGIKIEGCGVQDVVALAAAMKGAF